MTEELFREDVVPLQPGDRVTARIDAERRRAHMRLHTAAPLLCALLLGMLSLSSVARADAPPPRPAPSARADAAPSDAAIRRYLAVTHGVGPRLRKECGGAAPLKDLQVARVRLSGIAQELALVEATTCMMGNGGADIGLVLRRGAGGKLRSLSIDDGARAVDELYAGQRRTPRLQAREGHLVRWFVKDDPAAGGQSLRREISYRWTGERFLLDEVRDLPEPRR